MALLCFEKHTLESANVPPFWIIEFFITGDVKESGQQGQLVIQTGDAEMARQFEPGNLYEVDFTRKYGDS